MEFELEFMAVHGHVRRGFTATQRYLDKERREKEQHLTGSLCASTEMVGKGWSGQISPVSRKEEEDAPVAVVGLDSIP
jgi:hypothetical protein